MSLLCLFQAEGKQVNSISPRFLSLVSVTLALLVVLPMSARAANESLLSIFNGNSNNTGTDRATSPACKGCHGKEGDINPLTGRVHHSNDSPDAVILRSGPGDPDAGREKSLLCQGCHGEDGVSFDTKVPKLAGQYGDYISKQLRNYQSGVRSHQIMNAMAATISEEDLEDISAYFASQDRMDGNDSSANPIGQHLFYHSDTSRAHMACVNCHGISGKGLTPETAMFPVIGGQHKDYLLAQLLSFKYDDRVNSPNAIMNKVARALTDEELEALADFLSEQ